MVLQSFERESCETDRFSNRISLASFALARGSEPSHQRRAVASFRVTENAF